MNFATLQGLTIPEGVVTEIKNANGVILWAGGGKAVLEVEKITADTYAGETTYTAEQFILLDIYPKKANSVIDISYGGLTKTLTFSDTNAMQVFFGTFNGVTDSVLTPASGELTIKGDYVGFDLGSYQPNSKGIPTKCKCVKRVSKLGKITHVFSDVYDEWYTAETLEIPEGITYIGAQAYSSAKALSEVILPSTITTISSGAFSYNEGGYKLTSGATFQCYNPVAKKVILKAPIPPGISYYGDGVYDTALPFGNPGRPDLEGKIEFPSDFEIIVPKGCLSAYLQDPEWSYYNYYDWQFIKEEA